MQIEWNNIHVDFPDEPLLRLGVDGAAGTCRFANICNPISLLTVSYFWMSSSPLWLEFEVAST